jgi:hypothetical protein
MYITLREGVPNITQGHWQDKHYSTPIRAIQMLCTRTYVHHIDLYAYEYPWLQNDLIIQQVRSWHLSTFRIVKLCDWRVRWFHLHRDASGGPSQLFSVYLHGDESSNNGRHLCMCSRAITRSIRDHTGTGHSYHYTHSLCSERLWTR